MLNCHFTNMNTTPTFHEVGVLCSQIILGGIAYQQLKQQPCTVSASVQGGGRLSLYGESHQKRNYNQETL